MTMSNAVKVPKKLIEVALPLDHINRSARDEKAVPRPGHPQTMHYWWARRPLAAARAVIFAQMVNDPGYERQLGRGVNKEAAARERERLFGILEKLVKWENTTNEAVLAEAREEIRKSWQETCRLNRDHPRADELFNPNRLPAFHDPFCGGGALPLEAKRLGLEAHASDLNPVAVLITKAMIEIPPRFADQHPVNPEARANKDDLLVDRQWTGAQGLADDVRYYGRWMRDEADKRIGYLYPRVEITSEMVKVRPDLKPLVGRKLIPIAWFWARAVKSPNPAFAQVAVPLASTFILSKKADRHAYVEPVVENGGYRFIVKVGSARDAEAAATGTKLARANFACLMSETPISSEYIRTEGKAGRLGARLMAIVAETERGRVYLSPSSAQEEVAQAAKPVWRPEGEIAARMTGGNCTPYGLTSWGDLFSARQLCAVNTFSELISEVRERVERDAVRAGLLNDHKALRHGGAGASAYGEAVSVYLGCALSRLASYNNTICHWNIKGGSVAQIFARQAVPMSWDFIEVNPLEKMSGNWAGGVEWVSDVFPNLAVSMSAGYSIQANASEQTLSLDRVVSTDPPYYDNIGYADLSDFFYLWLRPSLRQVFPDLFATMTTPKAEELVAAPYRHGSKEKAEQFFLDGMTQAMHRLADQAHPAFPVTIYYAFKQSETEGDAGTTSTGWETFLEAVIRAGFSITGTWPMRTEKQGRMLASGTNTLASSIVLVCRPRGTDAPTVSRRLFLRELNQVLPEALDEMTRGTANERSPVAPVDLSQAIIGPGMAVFSKYAAILEADGTPMTVKTALTLINRFIGEEDFDADTQFCLHWFEQYGWKDGDFGEADKLARAKGTAVDGVKQSGVIYAARGVVRLVKWADYPAGWDPTTDVRLPVWEVLHRLIRVFKTEGESGVAPLLALVQPKAEAARQLAYRLHILCERSGWAEDARAYNELITSWSAIESAAAKVPGPRQAELFDV
jgi:putative DNA methylase